MAYSAFALSNHLLALAGDINMPVNPQKLQRLLFFAQVFHVSLYSEPLCDDTFVVWEAGPVIPALFHKCKAFGTDPITRRIPVTSADPDKRLFPVVQDFDLHARAFLLSFMNSFGRKPAVELCVAANQLLEAGGAEVNAVLDATAIHELVNKAGLDPRKALAPAPL